MYAREKMTFNDIIQTKQTILHSSNDFKSKHFKLYVK